MKNLDLNACGVQEMNAAEVAEVNGGFWQAIGLAALATVGVMAPYLAFDVVGNLNAHAKAWENGWNSVKQF